MKIKHYQAKEQKIQEVLKNNSMLEQQKKDQLLKQLSETDLKVKKVTEAK